MDFRECLLSEARFPRMRGVGNSAVVLSCVACRPRSTHVSTQDKASFREARLSETGLPRRTLLGNTVNKGNLLLVGLPDTAPTAIVERYEVSLLC
jgi:hypothetical protein